MQPEPSDTTLYDAWWAILLIVGVVAAGWVAVTLTAPHSTRIPCATETHYFPETRTTWVRLTREDGTVRWEMK